MLELLIVITIIAVLCTAAIPMVNSVQTVMLDNAVSQVRSALQFARQHARTTGHLTIVRFDNGAGIIRVNRIIPSLSSEQPLMHPLRKDDYVIALNAQPLTGTSIQLQALFTFSDGSNAPNVVFDRNGSAGRATLNNTLIPIKEPGIWRGFWRIGEGYSAGDWVEHEKILYDCLSSHFAGSSFGSDLSSGRWQVRTHPGQVRVSSGPHQQQIHVEPTWGFIRVRSQ